MKFKGFAGMDRSGNMSDFPLVVALAFSENKAGISQCYEKIRDLAIRINPILSTRSEIKSRDFNTTKSRDSALKLIVDGKIGFSVLFVKNDIFRIFNQYIREHKYQQKIEGMLWFECLRLYALSHNAMPQVIFVDETYPRDDQLIFASVIKRLCTSRLMFSPIVETVDSRFENAVKLADIVAGFFKADKSIQSKYASNKSTADLKAIREYSLEIFRRQ